MSNALARGIDPEHPESRRISATTLAGGNAIRLIQNAKANGFEVTMFYVGLGDYRLNIERVANRVKNGGHHIPTEDIIRRHRTSIQNLLDQMQLIDNLIVVDNSGSDGEIVLTISNGIITYRSPSLPAWVELIEQKCVEIN